MGDFPEQVKVMLNMPVNPMVVSMPSAVTRTVSEAFKMIMTCIAESLLFVCVTFCVTIFMAGGAVDICKLQCCFNFLPCCDFLALANFAFSEFLRHLVFLLNGAFLKAKYEKQLDCETITHPR